MLRKTSLNADDIIQTVADKLVLTMECYSIESCMRGYRLPAALLLYLLHQSQHEGWLVIEDHMDRGHCQLDRGNE